jgi:N-carbamoylputrescine amidase
MTTVTVAATQTFCTWNEAETLDRVEALVRQAAGRGAQIVLPQELFAAPYFCRDELQKHFALARPIDGHPVVERFRRLAAELQVAMPVSVFERANNAYYNSIAMVDADGSVLGVYRKSHIPDGPGYEEKFYFNPGDTGFKVWNTRYGKVGCGICWDQWYPETARCMALMGADVLLYPTAIGSEPQDGGLDSQAHWTRVMQGHAGANLVPLVASNRIGTEQGERFSQTFYGSSFIAGPTGELVAQAGRTEEEVLVARFDLDAIRAQRASWGLFRDRRPELYGAILTFDGSTRPS